MSDWFHFSMRHSSSNPSRMWKSCSTRPRYMWSWMIRCGVIQIQYNGTFSGYWSIRQRHWSIGQSRCCIVAVKIEMTNRSLYSCLELQNGGFVSLVRTWKTLIHLQVLLPLVHFRFLLRTKQRDVHIYFPHALVHLTARNILNASSSWCSMLLMAFYQFKKPPGVFGLRTDLKACKRKEITDITYPFLD